MKKAETEILKSARKLLGKARETPEMQQDRRQNYLLERDHVELDHIRENLRALQQDNDLKKVFANRIYYLSIMWLILMLVFFFSGLILGRITESVFLLIFPTTTLNILGLMVIVTRHIFSNGRRGREDTR